MLPNVISGRPAPGKPRRDGRAREIRRYFARVEFDEFRELYRLEQLREDAQSVLPGGMLVASQIPPPGVGHELENREKTPLPPISLSSLFIRGARRRPAYIHTYTTRPNTHTSARV